MPDNRMNLEYVSPNPPPPDAIVANVKRCDLCGGPVDRFNHLFRCRDCGAFGDLNTGIMVDLSLPERHAQSAA